MTYQYDPILGTGRDGKVTLEEQQAGFNTGTAAQKAAFQVAVSGAEPPLVYVQPDMSGAWPARPAGLNINIPAWASRAEVVLWSAGASGGSGRVGAAGTARSGGQGGSVGGGNRFNLFLRDASGTLLAPTMALTLGEPSPPGPSITTPDTNGAVSAVNQSAANSSIVFAGESFMSKARDTGGTPASTAGLAAASQGFGDLRSVVSGATSITGAAATLYVGARGEHVSSGSGGGSLSAANVALAPGQITAHYLLLPGTTAVAPGANGYYAVQGCGRILAVGGAGGAVGQAGGNGGPGCGGGGGGAALNGGASGAGGWGGFGAALISFA